MKTILRALAIAGGAAVLGLAHNAVSDDGIPLRTPPVSDRQTAVEWSLHLDGLRATLEDARNAYDDGALFLDARSARAYGTGHIAGARNLTVYRYRHGDGRAMLSDVPKDRHIVAYCSGGSCQSSTQLAKLLVEDGYTNVKCFYAGWPAWRAAGYPTRQGGAP